MHERECKGYISFNRGVNELNRGVNELNRGVNELNRGVNELNRGVNDLNRGVNHSVARQGCNLLRAAVTSAVTSQGCCCGNLQIHPLDLGQRGRVEQQFALVGSHMLDQEEVEALQGILRLVLEAQKLLLEVNRILHWYTEGYKELDNWFLVRITLFS